MNRIKKLLTAVAALALSATGLAQSETPYSMYGYGILGDRATSAQRQMGSVGYAMNSGRQVNVMNPASYAATDTLTFLCDLGADLTLLWSEDNGKKRHSTGGGVDYLTTQFPIGKYFGGSLGLVPLSSVGYAFGNDIKHGAMENQGTGGINELYLGFAGTVKGFSLGFNIAYDFGKIYNDVFTTPTGMKQTKWEHIMEVQDWNILIGAQYSANLSRFSKLTLGVTYSPKKTLLGNSRVTAQSVDQDARPDTVGSLKLKNNYYQPTSIGAGINYTYQKNHRLVLEADFTWQGWKDCKYSPIYSSTQTNSIVFSGLKFNDRTRYAAGAEYVPKIRGNYGQRIAYRLGAYYCNDYLRINNNSVREYGITGGFGLPTPEGKTVVNIGLEWKHRQAHPAAMVKENYLNITLGVNFNEVWFFKRKIR